MTKNKKESPQIIGTGLSGLIGSRVVELLKDKFSFIDFSLDKGVDITNFELLKKKFEENSKAETILHLAAFTDVDAAWKQRGDKNSLCYRVNVLGTRNIAKLCKQYKKYLIHISTDFIFDGKKKTFYTEYNKPNPIDWYGKTKFWAEQEVKKCDCKNVILRTGFPFKAKRASKKLEPKPKEDLVRKIIHKLKKNQEVKLFSDQIITPTFIDDIVKALEKIFIIKPQGIFHLVGSTPLSPYELALMVANIFDLPKEKIIETSLSEYLKQKDIRPRQHYLPLSNMKLKEKLGVRLLNIREALLKMKQQMKD